MVDKTRSEALDALRGLAVILMVQQHLGVWLVDRAHYKIPSAFVALNMSGGAAAPLFVFLAGLSAALPSRTPRSEKFIRGILLICLGYGLNLIVPSWFSWGSFYILHLLGTWLCFNAMVNFKRARLPLLLAFGVLISTVFIQSYLETPLKLHNSALKDLNKLGGPWRLALAEGHFPVFPWLSIALVGSVIGQGYAALSSKRLVIYAAISAALGLLARLPFLLMPAEAYQTPLKGIALFTFYPASTSFILLLIGLCLGLLALFKKLESAGMTVFLASLVPFGRTSLTLLVAHVYFFRELSIDLQFKKTLAPLPSLAVIIAFILGWSFFARRWARFQYRYGLEWWLRRLSRNRAAE